MKSSYTNCCFAEKFTTNLPEPTRIVEFALNSGKNEIHFTRGSSKYLDENLVTSATCLSIDLTKGFDEPKVDMDVSYLHQTLLLIQKIGSGYRNLRKVLNDADVVVNMDTLLVMASSWQNVNKVDRGWKFKATIHQGIVFVDVIETHDFTGPAATVKDYNIKRAKYCTNAFKSIVMKPIYQLFSPVFEHVQTHSAFTFQLPSTKSYPSLKYFYASEVDGKDRSGKYVVVKSVPMGNGQNNNPIFENLNNSLKRIKVHPNFDLKVALWYYQSTFINSNKIVVGLKNEYILTGIEVIDREEMRRDLGRSFSPVFGLQIVHMVMSQTRNILLANPGKAVVVERKSDELDVSFDVVDADLHPVLSEEFKKLFPDVL